MKSLDEILEARRRQITTLRQVGESRVADVMEEMCEEFADASSPFRDWLSETDAMLRADKSAEWLRKRFPAWERQRLARWNPRNPRQRQYLKCAVPQSIDLESVRADAEREAGRKSA